MILGSHDDISTSGGDRLGLHALGGQRMMKLLLVNGNTTQVITDRVVAEATRCAAPGTTITGVTARFGVSIISTEAENEIAGHAVLDALAVHVADHDAVVLAISFDTALLGAQADRCYPSDWHDRGQLADGLSPGAPLRPDKLRAKQPLDVSGSGAARGPVAAYDRP